METNNSSQETQHVGYLHVGDEAAPVGINSAGITLEDALYHVYDEMGRNATNLFVALALENIKRGQTRGSINGVEWKFEISRELAAQQSELKRLDPNGWETLEDAEQMDAAILRDAIAYILANS